MDIHDLTIEIGRGRTVPETASFACRDEDEAARRWRSLGWLRRQASEQHSRYALGLKEKPRAEAGRDLKWLCEPSDIT
jgi:hypothetical protein